MESGENRATICLETFKTHQAEGSLSRRSQFRLSQFPSFTDAAASVCLCAFFVRSHCFWRGDFFLEQHDVRLAAGMVIFLLVNVDAAIESTCKFFSSQRL
jgi:hypothetical protein